MTWITDPAPGEVPKKQPPSKQKPKRKPPSRLLEIYQSLTLEIIKIEEYIDGGIIQGRESSLTEQEIKRLDKSVTVLKVGRKMMKKVLRDAGAEGRLKVA